MDILINNVIALYPRLNKTYRFDSMENKSVPCDPLDQNAAYEIQFEMTTQDVKALWGEMVAAYNTAKQANWPDAPANPFKQTEGGTWTGNAKLKGSYNGELTKKPLQVDASNKKLGEDFILTTGSKVNLSVTPVPYVMQGNACVSLRLRAVQVVEYKPMEEHNPFGAVQGYTASSGADWRLQLSAQGDQFGQASEPTPPAQNPSRFNDLDDEIPF